MFGPPLFSPPPPQTTTDIIVIPPPHLCPPLPHSKIDRQSNHPEPTPAPPPPPVTTGQHALNQTDGLMSLYANMGTLDGLSKMFSERAVLLPAWVHFLAFDLVAAHYVVQKNLK